MTAGVFLFCHDILMLNEYIKKSIQDASCPRLSGKVSAELTKGASVSRKERMEISVNGNGKSGCHRTVLILACHSWTKWRIWAKNTGVIYAFNDYPMPDSSLRVKLCFSFVIIPILLAAQEWWQRCFCLPWYSVLCTHTCPFRLARLGTSLRVRGKLTLRKKEFIVFKYITWLLP